MWTAKTRSASVYGWASLNQLKQLLHVQRHLSLDGTYYLEGRKLGHILQNSNYIENNSRYFNWLLQEAGFEGASL